MNTSSDEDKIAAFVQKGGRIITFAPKHKALKTEKPFCDKCNSFPATRQFLDDDGNKYRWCKSCYDE